MARIDFYVLGESGERARQVFACRLADKAYRLDNTVHIVANSPEAAGHLDELLWTFRDGSFVPHEVLGASQSVESPVTIGCEDDDPPARDLLINLCDGVPRVAGTFPRIAELVTSDDNCRRFGRARFAAYREQGHEIETHNV